MIGLSNKLVDCLMSDAWIEISLIFSANWTIVGESFVSYLRRLFHPTTDYSTKQFYMSTYTVIFWTKSFTDNQTYLARQLKIILNKSLSTKKIDSY